MLIRGRVPRPPPESDPPGVAPAGADDHMITRFFFVMRANAQIIGIYEMDSAGISRIYNRGKCDNPSTFEGYSADQKKWWAARCDTAWAACTAV